MFCSILTQTLHMRHCPKPLIGQEVHIPQILPFVVKTVTITIKSIQFWRVGMRGISVLEKYRYLLYFKRYDIIILHNSVFNTLMFRFLRMYSTTPHPFSVNSVLEFLSRDTALIRNPKSTLFVCFKAFPLNVSFMRWSTCAFSEPVHMKSTHGKVCLTAPDNWTELSFAPIPSKHTRFMYRLSWLCLKWK